MANRNNIIDCFRAMAVILVTLYHVYRHIAPEFYVLGVNLYSPILNGWMGVGIFFVISGYCMGMATSSMQHNGVNLNSYTEYFKKRFLRISIPYYVAILFWVISVNYFHVLPKDAGWNDVLTHLFYVHNFNLHTMYSISGVFWSLAVEMQFYLLLPVLMMLFRTDLKRLLLVGALFLMSLTIHIFSSNNVILTWGLASYLYIFVLGWVLYTKKDVLALYLGGKIQLICVLFLYVAMMFVDPHYLKVNKFYELLVSSVFGLLMISLMSQEPVSNKKNGLIKVFAWVGRMSFSIYLYNYIYIAFGFPSKDSYGIPLVIFTFLFGMGMYYLVEKPYESIRRRKFGSGATIAKRSA